MHRSKVLIAGAVAGMALTATLAGTALAGPGGDNPNNPAYYGAGCTKVEYVDGTTSYLVPAGVTVYIKAGTVIYPFGPYAVDTLVEVPTGKDISFVISCNGGPTTT